MGWVVGVWQPQHESTFIACWSRSTQDELGCGVPGQLRLPRRVIHLWVVELGNPWDNLFEGGAVQGAAGVLDMALPSLLQEHFAILAV